jgi:LysM repeat protein
VPWLLRLIRIVLILILLAVIFGGVAYYITISERKDSQETYNRSVTLAVQTAVAHALFDATRTAEADIPHDRIITLGPNEFLEDVATRYNTTVDVLRMANGLAPDVISGSGQQIIVPEGVQQLVPPRRLIPRVAVQGDTLEALAVQNGVPLEVLQEDNPILAQRGIIPGDIVFIGQLI